MHSKHFLKTDKAISSSKQLQHKMLTSKEDNVIPMIHFWPKITDRIYLKQHSTYDMRTHNIPILAR